MKKYYAVRKGKVPGIYQSWDECKEQTQGFSNAEFKSFTTLTEAQNYMGNNLQQNNPQTEAIAYVDGSFSNDMKMFSFGAVLFHNDKKYEFSEAFSDPELISMRNVAGEIKGSEFVMQYCVDNNIKSVAIFYDYSGIEKWCTGEWKTTKSGTEHYRNFYLNIKDKLSVSFVKVKGHSGNEYNDLADSLAKSALNIL